MQFRTCLNTLNINLNQSQINNLIDSYRVHDGTGMINYAAFVANINAVSNPTEIINGTKSHAVFTDQEKEIVLEAVAHMNSKIKSERILLKPGFMDFDKSQQLHITSHQFLRVLKGLGLMPTSEEVFDLIIRKYCDRGTTAEVNYFKFCNDLDRPEDIFPGYVPKKPLPEPKYTRGIPPTTKSAFFAEATDSIDVINNRYQQPRVEISCDPSDIENRLRSLVVMKRVRIEQFFLDFDKLRKGHITKNQFFSILSQLNFNFT